MGRGGASASASMERASSSASKERASASASMERASSSPSKERASASPSMERASASPSKERAPGPKAGSEGMPGEDELAPPLDKSVWSSILVSLYYIFIAHWVLISIIYVLKSGVIRIKWLDRNHGVLDLLIASVYMLLALYSTLRHGMLYILDHRNQSRPLLRVSTSHRLHKYELVGHHHLMIALAKPLVPWRQSRPQHMFGIAYRKKLCVDLRDHLRTTVRPHDIWDDASTERALHQSSRKIPSL